jgi:hypothetical protein
VNGNMPWAIHTHTHTHTQTHTHTVLSYGLNPMLLLVLKRRPRLQTHKSFWNEALILTWVPTGPETKNNFDGESHHQFTAMLCCISVTLCLMVETKEIFETLVLTQGWSPKKVLRNLFSLNSFKSYIARPLLVTEYRTRLKSIRPTNLGFLMHIAFTKWPWKWNRLLLRRLLLAVYYTN